MNLKVHKNEEGFSLIVVIFAILFLGLMGLSMNLVLSTFMDRSVLEVQATRAFYVAEGGRDFILQRNFDLHGINFPNYTSTTGSYPGGTPLSFAGGQCWMNFYNLGGSTPYLESTGKFGNGLRVIRQYFEYSYEDGVHGGENVTMSSSQAGGGLLSGDLECGNACTYDPGYTISGTVSSGTATPPRIPNFQALLSLTTSTNVGDLNINGNYGTAAAPIYVHVTGNVSIGDNAGTIYGMIVADGDITVNVKQNATRNVYGTLASANNVTVDLKQSTISLFQAQMIGGDYRPIILARGNVLLTGFQTQSAVFQGAIEAGGNAGGGNITINLKQQDHMSIQGVLWAQNSVLVDSKQNSYIGIDPNAGQNYLGGELLKLTSWQEQ